MLTPFYNPLFQMLNLSKSNIDFILMFDFIKQHALKRCMGDWRYSCAVSELHL